MVQLGWLGAPYDTYLFSDFASVDPARYRAALFLSPAGFSEAQLRRLADWKREGRSLLFSGYPGYAAGKLGEACEIACEIGADTAPLRAAYRGEAYPSLPCSGPQVALLPGDGDVVLAREENGAVAAVLHRNREYQILWSVVPQLPAAMVREALLLAGAHIYLYTRDTVSAAGNLVCVHACEGGVKRVYFPRMGRAFDAIHGKRLPAPTDTPKWKCAGRTRLLRLELRKTHKAYKNAAGGCLVFLRQPPGGIWRNPPSRLLPKRLPFPKGDARRTSILPARYTACAALRGCLLPPGYRW